MIKVVNFLKENYNDNMKINVDEYNRVSLMLAGLFQFQENNNFVQTQLALTQTELLFYDDSEPSEVKGEELHYKVKKRVLLDDYSLVLNETIKKNRDLANLGRLVFISEDEEKTFIYYYFLEDKKQVKAFLKALKKVRIKSRNETVDLSHDNL